MFHIEKRLICLAQRTVGKEITTRDYSRKSDSKNSGSYKVVNSNDAVSDSQDPRFDASPNWELFGSRGHRFLLPGSVGPAWHETRCMVPVDGFNNPLKKPSIDFETLECSAQECPLLLRQGIYELFPVIETQGNQLITVVSLTRKKIKTGRKRFETDPEWHAITFMWAAQEICVRLKMAGYWADFINPFSGRPYLGSSNKSTLYETDERFRCIGFEISKDGSCKMIRTKSGSEFIGSLFTNAPPSNDFLADLLNE